MKILLSQDDGTEVDITDDIRVTYDVAVGSMDFGSGFLSTDEVTHLRRVQAALGAEPLQYQDDPCEDCAHKRLQHGINRDGKCFHRDHDAPVGSPAECSCGGFTFGGKREEPFT